MKRKFLKLLFTAFIAVSMVSCSKDDTSSSELKEGKVIIINQGNYTEQSASISMYDETTGAIQNRVYESANGVSIGATIISGSVTPDKTPTAALVCCYPDKVVFIDANTGKDKGTTITDGLSTPRNIVFSDKYIYVTNHGAEYNVSESGWWEYYKSYVAIYDRSTMQFQGKVLVGTDAEGLALYGNRLFVAVKEGVRVYDISAASLNLHSTLRADNVSGPARYFAPDKKGFLWVSFPEKGLVQINPSALSIANVVEVPVDQMDGYITCDAEGDHILTYKTLFNNQYAAESASVYSVNVTTGTVNEPYKGTYVYGVGVSPATGNIFTSEVSFTSNSVLKVVGAEGNLVNSATAGIGTSRYLFF